MTTIHGVIHGTTIALEKEPGFPNGQAVAVSIERIEPKPAGDASQDIPKVETWIDRLVFDSAVRPGERIVKGTTLAAEEPVSEMEAGRSDRDLLHAHPELTAEDAEALHHYSRTPLPIRRSFGAWADDSEELDKFLEWNRQRRKLKRREIDP